MIDQDKFDVEVHLEVNKIIKAVEELVSFNDIGFISVTKVNPVHYDINIKKIGQYALKIDYESQTLSLVTPLSGIHTYKFDDTNQWWLSIKETHNIEEMLMREFSEFAKGYLRL